MRTNLGNPLAHSGERLYVQYGCGLCAPAGWLNFDASPRLRLERMPGICTMIAATTGLLFPSTAAPGDIVLGLPIGDSTVLGVYCSHVLEHLPRDEVPRALRNTFRMLIPGGVFRLIVPDLHWRVLKYLASSEIGDPLAADRLLKECLLGRQSRVRQYLKLIREHFGNSAHLWMYDFAAMKALLEEAGFVKVRRCEAGDGDGMFSRVEDPNRFFEGDHVELALEAIRPNSAVNDDRAASGVGDDQPA
jgi:predicted SAM-dependent methyltransferase